MARKDKRLEKIRRNPKAVSFDDLRQVMEAFGFTLERSRGSHHVFDIAIGGQVESIVIPFHKPHVQSVYVKQVLALIDRAAALQEDESEGEDDGED